MLILFLFLSRYLSQQFSIRIYMQQLRQTSFLHVMDPCLLSALLAILVKQHKAIVTSLFSDGSKFTAELSICPFIDAIALVNQLISEWLSISFSIYNVLSLLVFPITMEGMYLRGMSELHFVVVQSFLGNPCIYLSSKSTAIDPKHEMTSKLRYLFCSIPSLMGFAKRFKRFTSASTYQSGWNITKSKSPSATRKT